MDKGLIKDIGLPAATFDPIYASSAFQEENFMEYFSGISNNS